MTDYAALTAGTIRFASGISFLVAPEKANKFWGDAEPPVPTARLLLHSMGYRDALIGGLLIHGAVRGRDTRGWFLASGRKVPRTGGVILAIGERAGIEAYVAADPFTIHGIAEYEITELAVTTVVEGLEILKR